MDVPIFNRTYKEAAFRVKLKRQLRLKGVAFDNKESTESLIQRYKDNGLIQNGSILYP